MPVLSFILSVSLPPQKERKAHIQCHEQVNPPHAGNDGPTSCLHPRPLSPRRTHTPLFIPMSTGTNASLFASHPLFPLRVPGSGSGLLL